MNIAQAKQIPIEQFMLSIGHSPQRRTDYELWYLSPEREEEKASFHVSTTKNVWYDFGLGIGGDVVDLVRLIYREPSISSALVKLEKIMGGTEIDVLPQNKTRQRNTPLPKVLQVRTITSKALTGYLAERGIGLNVAKRYLSEVHYQVGDKQYFALGMENTAAGWEVRNPYFKGSLGPKDITVVPGNRNRVLVFEGMLDFLTAASLVGGNLQGTAIVLNSVATKAKAVELIQSMNPAIIEVYPDNDASGRHLAQFLCKQLSNATVVDWSSLYEGYKDLNEWHMNRLAASRKNLLGG